MIKTSIAMTTYNGEKYLQEQLDSFLNQTILPDELIVVDDCSTDKTIEILRKFKEFAPFHVKIIVNSENIGSKNQFAYTKNFEVAAINCTNEIIFFSDQDDVWFNNKIEKHIELYLKDSNTVFVVNDAIRTNPFLSAGITQSEYSKIICNGNSQVAIGCCFSIKKDFLDILLPFPNFAAHDNIVNICAKTFGLRKELNIPLQYFRRFPNSLSSRFEYSDCVTKWQCILTKFKRLFDYIIQRNKCLYDFKRNLILINHLYNKKLEITHFIEDKTNLPKEMISLGQNKTDKLFILFQERYKLLFIKNKLSRLKKIKQLHNRLDIYSKSFMIKDIILMLYYPYLQSF